MADILHMVHVRAPAEEIFAALTDVGLLRGFFRDGARVDVRVVERAPAARLVWRCEAGPDEWVGTEIAFDLAEPPGDRGSRATVLRFSHRHWRAPTDFMAQCATAWARVLLRLQAWLETPEPDDVTI